MDGPQITTQAINTDSLVAKERVAVNRREVARSQELEPQGRSPRVLAPENSAPRNGLDKAWKWFKKAWTDRTWMSSLRAALSGHLGGSRLMQMMAMCAVGVPMPGSGGEDQASAEVSREDNPQTPTDEIDRRRIGTPRQWMGNVLLAQTGEDLVRPQGMDQPALPGLIAPRSIEHPIGSRLLPPTGPHQSPPHRPSPLLLPATIPIVDTLETDILSPLLDGAQRMLETRANEQAAQEGIVRRSNVEASSQTARDPNPEVVIIPPSSEGASTSRSRASSVQIIPDEPQTFPAAHNSSRVSTSNVNAGSYSSDQARIDSSRAQVTLQAAASAQQLNATSGSGVGSLDNPALELTQDQPRVIIPDELLNLGARAYSAYGDFQVSRMRAYRHLGMAPPDAMIPPVRGANEQRVYHVLLTAPPVSRLPYEAGHTQSS